MIRAVQELRVEQDLVGSIAVAMIPLQVAAVLGQQVGLTRECLRRIEAQALAWPRGDVHPRLRIADFPDQAGSAAGIGLFLICAPPTSQ